MSGPDNPLYGDEKDQSVVFSITVRSSTSLRSFAFHLFDLAASIGFGSISMPFRILRSSSPGATAESSCSSTSLGISRFF